MRNRNRHQHQCRLWCAYVLFLVQTAIGASLLGGLPLLFGESSGARLMTGMALLCSNLQSVRSVAGERTAGLFLVSSMLGFGFAFCQAGIGLTKLPPTIWCLGGAAAIGIAGVAIKLFACTWRDTADMERN